MDLDKLKYSYLTYLKIHIETQNPSGALIRSFLDSWFAYKMQGNFLSNGKRERWFNKKDIAPKRLTEATKDCLLRMHFISKNALNAINSESETVLIKDHAVPVKIIHKILRKDLNPSEESIEKLLQTYYSLGVLTSDEDKALNKLGLKSEMPEDWDGVNVFARYEKAGIQRADI